MVALFLVVGGGISVGFFLFVVGMYRGVARADAQMEQQYTPILEPSSKTEGVLRLETISLPTTQ